MKRDEDYKADLLRIVQKHIDRNPRSSQQLIGPSGAGGCQRKVAFQLAYGAAESGRPGGYASFKGTTMHSEYDAIFKATAETMTLPDGSPRFLSDLKLPQVSPSIAGGTLDLFDALWGRVIDFKFPGDGTMDKARAGTISSTYETQIQLYGLGAQQMGLTVHSVALLYMPMCGDNLHAKSVLHLWDFDPEMAWAAIRSVERIQNMLQVASPRAVMEVMSTKSDFCQSCPCFVGGGDRRAICPGASPGNRSVNSDKDPFSR